MPDHTPAELLKAALEISESAAAIPMRYFRSGVAVEDKSDESPVTIADRETEEQLRAAILERFPSHGIFGEEFGVSGADSDYVWVVDPIDGTKAFITGSPLFGMLIAILRNGQAEAGLIRMPALGECFAGARGFGATLNGAPIHCRPTPALKDSRIYINGAGRLMRHEARRFGRLIEAGRLTRFSDDCYPFGLLAAGQIDVVVDSDLKPYDYMAAVPVIEAAGGVISDWKGAPLGLHSGGTVLATGGPALHRAMLNLLR